MDTIITSMDAGTQTEGVEGKDYSIIYDHDGNLVKYWHNSHVVQQIKDAEIDDEIALEDHLNRKAGIYPEPDGDPSY